MFALGSQSWSQLFQQGRPRRASAPEKAVLFLMEATSSCAELLIPDRKSQHRSQTESARFQNKTNVVRSAVLLTLDGGCCATFSLGMHRLVKQIQNQRYLLFLLLESIIQRNIPKYHCGLIIILSCNTFTILYTIGLFSETECLKELSCDIWLGTSPSCFQTGFELGNRCDPRSNRREEVWTDGSEKMCYTEIHLSWVRASLRFP